jgi:hypothetical protein
MKSPILAACAIALACSGARPAFAAPPRTAGLEARMSASLAAGQIVTAGRQADSLLAARRARDAENPLAAASYLDTLGLRFLASGSPEGWPVARRYLSRALAVREKTLGKDDLDVAGTLSHLAMVDDFEGRWADALPLEQRSLAIRIRNLGEWHPAVAASRR